MSTALKKVHLINNIKRSFWCSSLLLVRPLEQLLLKFASNFRLGLPSRLIDVREPVQLAHMNPEWVSPLLHYNTTTYTTSAATTTTTTLDITATSSTATTLDMTATSSTATTLDMTAILPLYLNFDSCFHHCYFFIYNCYSSTASTSSSTLYIVSSLLPSVLLLVGFKFWKESFSILSFGKSREHGMIPVRGLAISSGSFSVVVVVEK